VLGTLTSERLRLLQVGTTAGALAGAMGALAAWRFFFASPGAPGSFTLQRKATPDPELAASLLADDRAGVFAGRAQQQQQRTAQQRTGSSWELLEGKQQGSGQKGGGGFVQGQEEPLPFAAAAAQQQAKSGGEGAAGMSRAAAPSPVDVMQLYDQQGQVAGPAAAGSEAYSHMDSQPVVPYSVLLLLCYLVPFGMQVAGAAKADLGGCASLGLPLALLALPLGAALGGLLSAVLGQRRRLVAALAAALYSAAPLTAGGVLASLPIGVVPSEDIAYEGAAAGAHLATAAAGALVAGGLLVCWPAAERASGSRAGAGVFVGAALTLLVCAALGGLCMGTPYCLKLV
jgi:hypothetical protein